MTQRFLFNQPLPVPPTDPNVQAEEAPRLSKQSLAILNRLRQGPATNKELATLALKYTSRISDLRAAGYNVRVVEQDYKNGRRVYELTE